LQNQLSFQKDYFLVARHPTSMGGKQHSIFRFRKSGLVALGKIALSD